MITTIKKIGINGEGIGYYKKKPVFIDDCLPDEVVEFEIKEEKEKYIIGNKINLVKTSDKRIKAKCYYYDYCGGCQLMHTDYRNQLVIKRDFLAQTLEKYAKLNPKIIGKLNCSKHEFYYRNELKLPVRMFMGKLVTGMYLKGSNSLKRVNNCIVHEKMLERVKDRVLDCLNECRIKAYDGKNRQGLRYIILRGFGDNYQLQLIFGNKSANNLLIGALAKIAEIKSIYFSYNTNSDPLINKTEAIKVYGEDKLLLEIDGYKFMVSMEAFVQLNLTQAVNIFHYIGSLIKPGDVLVEEYCGIGIMSTLYHKKFKKIYASELNSISIDDFNYNLSLNGIDNIETKASDAYLHLKSIKGDVDYLLVDPPRSGLDHRIINEILKKNIKNIIYMSCSPSSLAKNIDALKHKYKVLSVEAFDMFPNTSHVETVCLMSKS